MRLKESSLLNFFLRFPLMFLFVNGLLITITTHLLYAKYHSKKQFPHYKIDVTYDHDKTLLTGKMQVRFAQNSFSTNELLFSLPGNRFSYPDERGTRKHKIVPVFSLKRFEDNIEDPKSPIGFSKGSLKIKSVSLLPLIPSVNKQQLKYSLEQNPDLEVGYSTANGLLRILLPKTLTDTKNFSGESTIQIEFSTQFPKHTQEGTVNGMLMAVNWHPKLLIWNENAGLNEKSWETTEDQPSPATFEVIWKAVQAGTLITTPGHQKLSPGQTVTLSVTKKPIKYFPLIFSKMHEQLFGNKEKFFLANDSKNPNEKTYYQLTSFYFGGHEQRAKHLHNWSAKFLSFMHSRYGLYPPWESIRVIAVETEYEQVEVLNNLVLVPLPNYKRSEFLDRQALGFLTRRLAQIWFGESVWSNQDTQQWLNLGIPAFLGLRFFQYHFGQNAGIFDAPDWLNPRYRDHFFEKMANSVSPKFRYPIISSFRKNPDSQKYLQTLTYKTATVLNMLEFIIGKKSFQKGMRFFAQNYQQNVIELDEFQQAMEKFTFNRLRDPPFLDQNLYNVDGKESLEWFFSQWFYSVKTLDYSFGESTTRTLPNGMYETEVIVKKIGLAQMPLIVSLKAKDGSEIRKLVPGIKNRDKIFFQTSSFPEKFSLDPDELLLETSRINNHSYRFFRIRFGFDWKKQREHLVLIVPGFGNNAFDGNSVGVGIRYRFDDYSIYAIPGYGSKNKRGLYIFDLDTENLGFYGMEAGVSAREYGGVRSHGIRCTYKNPNNPHELEYEFHSSFSREILFSARSNPDKNDVIETGESNAFLLEHTGSFSPWDSYKINWNIWNEQPSLEMGSDFAYVRSQAKLGQILRVGHRKWFEFDIIHATTSGKSPLQKKFQLGSPTVLRGYPQQTDLSDDYLLASRLDFKFPLITNSLWGILSAFKIQGTMFYDQGKIWSENISYENSKHRENAGIGLEWTLDTASLFQVPLKIEVAFPLNDSDYNKPQFIFLGVLTGS